MKEEIRNISKYLKNKYPSRYTLKISQAADELRLGKKQVKELIETRKINSLSIKSLSSFIIGNPPKKVSSND